MLSPGSSEVCKDAILVSYTKHPAQFSRGAIILNLFGERTCRCFSEMFHVNIWLCPATPWFESLFITTHSSSLPDASQICKLVLFGLGTVGHTYVEPGYDLNCTNHRMKSTYCHTEYISPLTEVKQCGTELLHTHTHTHAHTCIESNLTRQRERLWELPHCMEKSMA
jgi:hypothetical protein